MFGSVARGEAGPEGDLDLLVEMEADHSLLDLVGLGQDLEEFLHRRVDVLPTRVSTQEFANRFSPKRGPCEGRAYSLRLSRDTLRVDHSVCIGHNGRYEGAREIKASSDDDGDRD